MDGDILAAELLEKIDIMSLDSDEMAEFIESTGEKSFRAKQLYGWIHKKLAYSFDEMTNLPKEFREKLNNNCTIDSTSIADVQESADGTRKYLMQLSDGNAVESVLMKYKHGNSVCISTQAGCRMGCKFCASTTGGLDRNLKPSEMLGQIYRIQRATGERVSNVILMGIGEPLDNYANVVKFIKMLSDRNGLNISQRNITLSTCGLVEKLISLVDEHLGITIAISLHAPDDALRRSIMPVACKYSIHDIIKACKYYIEKTGRRITFEYSLMEGVNDRPEHAEKLAGLLYSLNCHVNLIPLNPVKGRMGNRPAGIDIQHFKSMLEKKHINVTIRREMGSDIDAACGQLRNKNKGG
ncbi:MAG TPA: 23S rRNA (adenine(2503)-C(2))-methyltransferase RlmN [Lachnospiraceae bacterium]|nr:23S rRNA (adenine(2503)-C(2))-methyltransferase RlmN [Lachnospiraceae bacterium]